MLRLSPWSALPLAYLAFACGSASDRSELEPAPCASCNEAGAAGAAGQNGDLAAAGQAGSGTELTISEISFWQALRIPLALNGAAAPANAPIVANKSGILRIYVSPGATFRARELSVALSYEANGVTSAFTSKKLIRGASEQGEFGSTFNFPIDASQVVSGASYSVRLLTNDAEELDRYPVAESSALSVESAGALHVVVVPLVVGGVMPDVSPAKLDTFRARVLSMYPLAELSLNVHEPVVSAGAVGPSAGWDALLDSLYALRAQDAPADNVFYYGMFTPTKNFDEYCVSNCTVGYSAVTDATDIADRGSVGLGIFPDGSNSDAPDTMAHELGHALGRDHAPCNVAKGDAGPFPYPGGKIGVWGFDSLNHLLLDPSLYGDVMGYCTPDWISDFTYRALFERIQGVNAEPGGIGAKALRPSPGAIRRVLVHQSVRAGSLPMP